MEQHHPALIVLDVMMPELDGFDVVRRLRDAGDRTPIILLTARDATEATEVRTSGVAVNGVKFEPGTAETLTCETGENYRIEALQETYDLGLDFNNAHVQPTGEYHYHGISELLAAAYEVDDDLVQIGCGGQGGGGEQGGGGQGGGGAAPGEAPDLSEAAEALGLSADELMGALGTPPNIEAAAESLGIAPEELTAVLPGP